MAEPSVDSLVELSAEKWSSIEGIAGSDLLRLSILRELLNNLHAQKSRYLSKGKRQDAGSIRSLEDKIEELKHCKPLSGDLPSLLSGKTVLKKRTRILPDSLFAVIDREKLERYDRQWEGAIASEALSSGWKIWSIEAWVDVPRADEWNRKLAELFWPDGLVLFVESAGGAPKASLWQGRWIVVLHPKFATVSDIRIDAEGLPVTEAPPVLRLLFSPKSS